MDSKESEGAMTKLAHTPIEPAMRLPLCQRWKQKHNYAQFNCHNNSSDNYDTLYFCFV